MSTDRDYGLTPAPGDLAPAPLREAQYYAHALARADMLPEGLRGHPGNTLLVLLMGRDLGLPWTAAVNLIAVIGRRPVITGKLWAVLIARAGHTRVTVASDTEATVKLTRRDTGETYTAHWTLQHAEAAGLCKIVDGWPQARSRDGKPLPWELYPRRMLIWRATSEAASILCPELALGMEIGDEDMAGDAALVVDAERTDQPAEAELSDDEIAQVIAEYDTPQQAGEPDDPGPTPPPHHPPTLKAMRALHARIGELGWPETDRHAVMSHVLERPISSAKQLTADDVSVLLAELGNMPAAHADWPLDRTYIADHGRKVMDQ